MAKQYLIFLSNWFYRLSHLLVEFRRKKQKKSSGVFLFGFLLMIMGVFFLYMSHFQALVKAHHAYHEQFVISDQVWWQQQSPILPIYSNNRFGKRTGLLNIQYAGSLSKLEQTLLARGWKKQSNSFFYSLLLRASGKETLEDRPVKAQLYLNKKPKLVMTFALPHKTKLSSYAFGDQIIIYRTTINLFG